MTHPGGNSPDSGPTMIALAGTIPRAWRQTRNTTLLCGSARALSILFLLVLTQAMLRLGRSEAADEAPFGIERRILFTTSRVVGSPDPPLPYTVEKAFTNINWQAPLYVAAEPDSDRLLVVLQGGDRGRPSKILRITDEQNTSETEIFLQLTNRLIYSVEFHPGYRTNGFLFVFSNGPTPQRDRTNRISRFQVERRAPFRCDPASEATILEWRSAGHDGGGMVFGKDGMFYISTGDGTTDSDTWVSGQELSELLGGVLRIDVDRPEADRLYSVPRDNPFVSLTGARPENWAYGLRNPWRMAVDQRTGQIWVGNNGQDLWETIHLIRRGENYGWSVYEGNHPFYLNRKLGPTPLVPPTIEHHHTEARSLTGGVVYYGEQFPELNGTYLYGDYSTGRIWGARHDESRLTWHKELADTQIQIAGFATTHRGQVLIVDHGGGLYRLVRAAQEIAPSSFPVRLSDTGLFLSTKDHRPDPALIPYSVNAEGWTDGAKAQRWIALPGESRIEYTSSGGWNFPDGTVLAQTLSLEREVGNPASTRRVETRLLTRQKGEWAGYSYKWDEAQSDAILVPSRGEEHEFIIRDPAGGNGGARQPWRYPSRSECMACHSRAANFVLGLTELQMNKVHRYEAASDNQLRTLQHLAVFNKPPGKSPAELPKLANPYDETQPLEARARSYLHANCSVCHVEAGGGNSQMELGFTTRLERMRILEARPQHDTFGIDNAMLVAPGDPDRSILFQRLSRRGRGQMPPLVSARADEKAVTLFREWIRQMTPQQKFVRDWKAEDLVALLPQVKAGRSIESGRSAFRQSGCSQCHRFDGAGGSVGPDLTGLGKRLALHELLEAVIDPSKTIAEGYASAEIELTSGESLIGRIEREDDQTVVIRTLAAPETPKAFPKREIARRAISKVSNMPTGTLNTLEEKQILDLFAFLVADGDPSHPVFQSDGGGK